MIYLLFGKDTYRSRKRLREIIAEYKKTAGTHLNFHGFDGELCQAEKIKEALGNRSLFSSKKLISIDSPFSCEPWSVFLGSLEAYGRSSDTLIFLWEGDVLGKERLEKLEELKKVSTKVQEFKELDPRNLTLWIRDEAAKRGVRLSNKEIEDFAGLDLWKISNELDKLGLGIKFSGRSSKQESIFTLGDSLLSHPKQSVPVLLSLLHEGQDEFDLFNYAAGHIRKLFLVKWFSEKREAIPASAGIHPFVAKKASMHVRLYSLGELSKKFLAFFDEDRRIKTGLSRPHESLFAILIGGEGKSNSR